MAREGFVAMEHPESGGGIAWTHEDAFNLLWAPKGWVRADTADALGKRNVDELRTFADEQGVNLPTNAKKADYVRALTGVSDTPKEG